MTPYNNIKENIQKNISFSDNVSGDDNTILDRGFQIFSWIILYL